MKVDHALALLTCLCLLSFSQAQDDQAATLLAIKAAVGATNNNLLSWDTGGPCTDNWAGVTCNSDNDIVGLNMSNFGLNGVLPSNAFSKLTELRSLDLSNNYLKSPLPTFDPLKNLRDFNFSKNNYSEPLPPSLFGLTDLVELNFDSNDLTGIIPEEISNLKLLEEIWLGRNQFTGPLPLGLASLSHLKIVTIWGSDLDQTLPPEWGAWVNITYLNLRSAKIKGSLPSEWGQNFTKLQRLVLYTNDLTGNIPDSWKNMRSLQEFRFKNNRLSGVPPSWLAAQLEESDAFVDLSCNFFSGPYPNSNNDTVWKGNCFDSDPRGHDLKCTEGTCEGGPLGEGGEKKSSFPVGAIAGIIVAAILLLCAVLVVVFWARSTGSKRKRRRRDADAGDWEVPQGVRRFTYKEITKSTKSFDASCEIGEGGFGKVYVAQLDDGKYVAIKRASDLSFQGTKEFQNEITLLSRLHHRHLVRLEGFCDDRDEQILVYEYMINGNLHRHLIEKQAANLNWYRRLEIALAVAQGLDYLHSFADPPVIHRDVKPSNILLDDNMVAKVSDFGISKANPEMDTHVSTRPAGTAGYLDPEYFLRRQLTTASDVYGYGVVLLELITGQLAIDHKRLEDYNLVGWVKPKLVRKGIHAVIDPRLGPNFPVDAYEEVAEIAVSCTAFEKGDRPSMQAVASKLEHILSGLIPPPEHLVPISSPSLSPLLKEKQSSSQFSAGGGTGPLSDVKIEFGFKDTAVEPR
ncbi:hypothetical protein GOP47_0029351 [Adiantum capillus-veneris]|nr:hypothetical protein GOP47_0029351 [Adiantum capillus-veneris]